MFKKIRSGGLLSILVLGSGNVVGTIISAIALIIFSRFMGPTEFGLFSAAFALMQIMIKLVDLGVNTAAERSIARAHSQSASRADRLIRVTFWLKLVSFSFFLSVGWFAAPLISHSFLHINDVRLIHSAIALSLGTIIFDYTTLVFQATHQFSVVARMTIAQAFGKLFFGILLWWQGMLSAGLGLLVYGLMPGVGALWAWTKRPLTSLRLPSTWTTDLRTVFGVAKWTAMATIAATVADNIDTLMVQSFLSSYATGIWGGATRIAAFGSLLGWSIGSVLSIRVTRYGKREHLTQYLSKAWKVSLAAFLLLVLVTPFSSFLIWATIGNAYAQAAAPLQLLLIAAGISAANSPFSALFYLLDKPQYYAIAGTISTLTLVIGDYFLIPHFGLMGAAYVRLLVKIIIFAFTVLFARRALKEQYKFL
jgi:O-antigen/teichoic acid export membrane protein